MAGNSSETERLLQRAAEGSSESWGVLVDRHGDRLHRMVAFRLDHRLHRRVDPSDVIQETYLEAWKHLADYVRQPSMPFFLWLRSIAGHKLQELHRTRQCPKAAIRLLAAPFWPACRARN